MGNQKAGAKAQSIIVLVRRVKRTVVLYIVPYLTLRSVLQSITRYMTRSVVKYHVDDVGVIAN